MDTTLVKRPDVDIEEDIRKFVRSYSPIKQAQGHFEYSVKDGHVTISGHVRSVQAHRVMIDNIPDIEGVVSMDASQFYNDEDLRIKLGTAVSSGVLVRVNYGSVVVTGHLPPGKTADEIIEAVKKAPGVRADRVVAEFI